MRGAIYGRPFPFGSVQIHHQALEPRLVPGHYILIAEHFIECWFVTFHVLDSYGWVPA
jgi:hypothetical protein